MKKIKIGYSMVLFCCAFLFVFNLDISLFPKVIILFVLLFCPIVFYFLTIAISSVIDSQLEITLKALVDQLPQMEFKKLLFEIIKTYDHTLNGLLKTWDRISEYAIDNFSEENQHRVGLAFQKATENLDKEHTFKALKINRALKMENNTLFYQYLSGFDKSISIKKVIVEYSVTIFYSVILYCPIIFVFFPNYISFLLLPFSTFFSCVLYFPISKIIKLSYIFVTYHWLIVLIISIISPFWLSPNDFHENEKYFTLIIPFLLFTIIFSGIWITNKLWTSTDIENKNKGTFISNGKLLSVIHTKFIMKTRWIWLWIAFFSVIAYMIVFFALIYYQYFDLGDLYYCFLFSISLFFGECNTEFNTLEGLYFSMEIIFSFITNTLFLANIVRLIFEPRIFPKKK